MAGIGNWDGQIKAKGFMDFMKTVSDMSKSGDDYSNIAFKLWDNSERKSENPNFPDYTVSFRLNEWNSVISVWKSKPRDENESIARSNAVPDQEEKIDPNDLPF